MYEAHLKTKIRTKGREIISGVEGKLYFYEFFTHKGNIQCGTANV